MTSARSAALLLALPVALFAQQLSHPVMASRDDASRTAHAYQSVPDTVRLLAVMVQFQLDADPRTTGTGQFDLTPTGTPAIDQPPHNKRYFQDHLTFLENYYRKSSRGKVVVRSTVLDSVVTLSGTMLSYTTPVVGATVQAATLAGDTWHRVDSLGRVPDFSQYDCFVVFHAGAGHDIDLVPTLGYDPAPLDLASLYLGINAFRQAFGSGYQGIPVNGGAVHITNTIVVPETESRTIPGVGGDFLLPFSINGLLCASVGNFLGLPDLFDTQNGRTGIGRFGLMDGQAIFSFFGLFPPEPSAWEKYWLGWVEPILVPPGISTLELPAVAIADSIYRVPISGQEYFLVENRNRDPGQNGQTVTTSVNGVLRQQSFRYDTLGFESGDVSALSGVVTDVEDLDWSLPGGVDVDGTFFDGGILIWHIDEAVIAQTIASDAVNADPNRRGVDLEEADGSQDIGQSYDFLSPGSGSEEGTALDFWFLGNSSPVNKNEFSASTFPSSNSNSGASSHVTIYNFSARSPRMTAAVRRGDPGMAPVPGFPKVIGEEFGSPSLTIATLLPGSIPVVIAATQGTPLPKASTLGPIIPIVAPLGKVFAWRSDTFGALAPFQQGGLLTTTGSPGTGFVSAPAVITPAGGGTVDTLVLGQSFHGAAVPESLRTYVTTDLNGDSLADALAPSAVTGRITTPAVIGDSVIAIGGAGRRVWFFLMNRTPLDSIVAAGGADAAVVGISRLSPPGTILAPRSSGLPAPNSFVVAASDGTLLITSRSTSGGTTQADRIRNFGRPISGPAVAATFGQGNIAFRIAFATTDGYLYLVDTALAPLPGFPVFTGGPIAGPPALADVDGDGVRDLVVLSGFRMCAYNVAGVPLSFFPYTVHALLPFASAPIVGDVDGDGIPDIVGVTADGLVVAFNRTGRTVRGFPLQVGRGTQCAAMFTRADSIFLAVTSSDDGSVSAWLTGISSGPQSGFLYPWPQYQHDAQFSGADFSSIAGSPISSEFFPKERAYNWPNPVYGATTHLRYYVKENAAVNIRIFDLAGDLVTQLSGQAVGGIDNEIDWDVSGVQSGVYFARIEASGQGQSGVAIVKVAVVK